MRWIGLFLRVLLVVTLFALIFLPEKFSFPLLCASTFSFGLWAILFPAVVLRWLQRPLHLHDEDLDPSDESLWWLPMLAGTGMITISVAFLYLF